MKTVSISSFSLNPDNPRCIRDAAFRSLVESIKRDPEFLEKRGIVHADGVILGGNQRYSAVKEALKDDAFRKSLGLDKGMIPASWVQDASDWSEEKRRRFIIIDNGSYGEWDFDMLANSFDDLPLKDFGVGVPKEWTKPKDEQDQKKEKLTLSDIAEDNPKLAKFIEQREKSRARGKDKNELNFWVCLIFQSYDQKIEFLNSLPDLQVKYGMYVDGEAFAEATGIRITPNTQKPFQSPLDKNLIERVME